MNGGKSHMPSQRVDETVLVKYLLGNLAEPQEIEVEDRAFADAEYLSALETVEADLIDAYVRGELPASDRRQFELRFLTSPNRRSKVEFARALATVASESQVARRPAAREVLSSLVRGWSPTLQFAAGLAAMIFVAGVSWLIVQNAAMRSRVGRLEADRRASETREQTLRQQLAAQSQKQQPPAPQVAPSPAVASLVLLPGLTRSEGRVERLSLNSSVQIVHVTIQLEARDDYLRFRVEVRTRGGREVLTMENLPKRRSDAGYSVSFDLPASALSGGEYEMALKGIYKEKDIRDVGYYYFSAARH